MINYIWLGLMAISVIVAGFTGNIKAVTDAAVDNAKTAVDLALGLIGVMALWLGVMKIAERAGLITLLAKLIKPITKRLFPNVPPEHPAMGSMLMNISANWLGLGNAATPLGLKAMQELQKLNSKKDTATNAMCTFLVINTSTITFIPATVIAIRAAAGAKNPTDIIATTIFASACATIVGVITVKILEKISAIRERRRSQKQEE